MNNKFHSPPTTRDRSGSSTNWRRPAAHSWGELTKSVAQSVTRQSALKKFGLGLGLAGTTLTGSGLATSPRRHLDLNRLS